MTNTELVPLMGGWLMQSALLPSTLEFSSFWQSLLARLRGSQASTDWDEPLFADYLEKCAMFMASPQLLGDLGMAVSVPPGYMTYASNTQERTWRTLKGLLKKEAWPMPEYI